MDYMYIKPPEGLSFNLFIKVVHDIQDEILFIDLRTQQTIANQIILHLNSR